MHLLAVLVPPSGWQKNVTKTSKKRVGGWLDSS